MMRPPVHQIIHQLFGLAGRAASPKRCFFGAADTTSWPASAIDQLLAAKLIEPARDADEVECCGCEEHCSRPIEIFDHNGGSPRLFVSTCDLFENLGPFLHAHDALVRWQTSRHLVTKFVQRECSLTIDGTDDRERRIRFRTIEHEGVRRSISLEFTPYPIVRIGTMNVELEVLMSWQNGLIRIDQNDFQDCFRASEEQRSGDKRHQASRTVQEDNKVLTEIRDRRMQRRFEVLAIENPRLNKEQLAAKLVRENDFAKMTIGRILRIVRMPLSP